MITILARLVLRHLRRVDPDVLAEIKVALSRDFNARTKKWSDAAIAEEIGA